MKISAAYSTIRHSILNKLAVGLAPNLYYHCVEHTIDVLTQAERMAKIENLTDDEIYRLQLACLYHDSGFLTTYTAHEIAGCDFARKELTRFGVTDTDIRIICGMIMATHIPQTPLTRLEEIICDADLDYLGREDFSLISHNLFRELHARQMIKSEQEWNLVQINFFRQHSYFTDATNKLRGPLKSKHLAMIEATICRD